MAIPSNNNNNNNGNAKTKTNPITTKTASSVTKAPHQVRHFETIFARDLLITSSVYGERFFLTATVVTEGHYCDNNNRLVPNKAAAMASKKTTRE